MDYAASQNYLSSMCVKGNTVVWNYLNTSTAISVTGRLCRRNRVLENYFEYHLKSVQKKKISTMWGPHKKKFRCYIKVLLFMFTVLVFMNIHAHILSKRYIYLIWKASASDEKNSCRENEWTIHLKTNTVWGLWFILVSQHLHKSTFSGGVCLYDGS